MLAGIYGIRFQKNISQTFRFKAIGKARNYLFEKIEQNELMSRKSKKDSTTRFFIWNTSVLYGTILASAITGCISIFDFESLILCIPIGITSSAIKLKNCAIDAGIKKYKSIIKKKKKKHNY